LVKYGETELGIKGIRERWMAGHFSIVWSFVQFTEGWEAVVGGKHNCDVTQ